jgi:hypothetical protein
MQRRKLNGNRQQPKQSLPLQRKRKLKTMSIRKRNDAEGWKRGEGAYTGAKPEPTKDLYERDDWNPEQTPTDPWSYPGEKSKETVYEPAYSKNSEGDSAQRGKDDYQFSGPQSRDIFNQVTRMQRPRDDDDWGADATGPVKEVE